MKEESQEILKNKIEEKNLEEDGETKLKENEEVKLEELKNNQFGEINKSIKKLKIEETKLFEDLENNVSITLDKPKFLKDNKITKAQIGTLIHMWDVYKRQEKLL